MAPRARGITSELYGAFESTFAQPVSSGSYWQLPFYSDSLGEAQGLSEDPELGFGREPQQPVRDARNVDGDIVAPGRLAPLGVWLKALLGAPTTTGSGPDYTHTFTSGAETLPSLTLEKKLKDGAFLQYPGIMANQLTVSLERGGNPRFTFGLLGTKENKLTSSSAGTPTKLTSPKFQNFQGTLQADRGSGFQPFALVTSFDLTWNNGLEQIPEVGDGGIIQNIDPGAPSLSGSFNVRFTDFTNYDAAANNDALAIELKWQIAANRYLTLTMHRVRLPKPKHQISGPGGIEVSYDWRGEYDSGQDASLTAELSNDQSDYTNP
jgi:hypothetical protein